MFRDQLLRLLGEPGARETYARDRDAMKIVAYQAAVLRRKPALRREIERRDAFLWSAYGKWQAAAEGPVVEVGTGLTPFGGRDVIHTDVYLSPSVDFVADALHLPFPDGTLAGIVGIHTFHHLADPLVFLNEVARVLLPGGVLLLLEPNFNALSSFVFRYLHPERFDPNQRGWRHEIRGDADANQALSWIVFFRDRQLLVRGVPTMEFCESTPHNSLPFLLVGGFLLRQLLPMRAIDLIARVAGHEPLLSSLSVHRLIVMRKRMAMA